MSPRIYVASLADYNAGELHGVWIDIDGTTDVDDDVMPAVRAMLAESPTVAKGEASVAEEWAIHDFEGFEGYKVSEYADLANVTALGAALDEHGAALAGFLVDTGDFDDDTLEKFKERTLGTHSSRKDYAWQEFEELHEETYKLVTSVDFVDFDDEAYIRAMECDGYLFVDLPDGEVAVFAPDR